MRKILADFLPDIRIIPIPPIPAGVAMAAIVSIDVAGRGKFEFWLPMIDERPMAELLGRRRFKPAHDIPLLGDGQQIVYQPIKHQT